MRAQDEAEFAEFVAAVSHRLVRTAYAVDEHQTGAWFTVRFQRTSTEVKAREVDGTIFDFRAVEAGQYVVEDADRDVVARDRGAVMYTFLFDTLGDGAPGGEYLTDFLADPRGKYEVADLCAIAEGLTS